MHSSKFFESLEKLYKLHGYFNYLISEMKRSAMMGFSGIVIDPDGENDEYISILKYLGFHIETTGKKINIKWSNSSYPSYNTDNIDCSDILPDKFREISRTFAEIRSFMSDFEKEAKLTALVKGKREYYKKIPGNMDIDMLEDYLDIVYGGDVDIDDKYYVYTDWGWSNLSNNEEDDETQDDEEENYEVDEEKGED